MAAARLIYLDPNFVSWSRVRTHAHYMLATIYSKVYLISMFQKKQNEHSQIPFYNMRLVIYERNCLHNS